MASRVVLEQDEMMERGLSGSLSPPRATGNLRWRERSEISWTMQSFIVKELRRQASCLL